jgi:hypothetical protein
LAIPRPRGLLPEVVATSVLSHQTSMWPFPFLASGTV